MLVDDNGTMKYLQSSNALATTQHLFPLTYNAEFGWQYKFVIPASLTNFNVVAKPVNSVMGPSAVKTEEHFVYSSNPDGTATPGATVAP